MAAIALPSLSLSAPNLRGLVNRRVLGAVGAAGVLALALGGLAMLLATQRHDPGKVRLPLADAIAHAPQGWLQTLPRLSGPVVVSGDVVQLTEKPVGVTSGVPWNRPGPAPQPLSALPAQALPAAPIAGFFAPGPAGPLPIIATDGRLPFDAYRRPFLSNGRPRVALMIGGLGLNARLTQQAIETLPGEITLSFVPYAEGLQGWIDMARAHGHEVMIEAPMEPDNYPDNDPGPYTLLSDARPPEIVQKMEWVLSRATGYMGVTNYLGSRFLDVDSAYGAMTSVVKGRGLAFVDDGAAGRRLGGGVIRGSAERVIDEQVSRGGIDQQLLALEASAGQRGQALGAGFAYPVTLDAVGRWAETLEQRGLQLAPASALVKR